MSKPELNKQREQKRLYAKAHRKALIDQGKCVKCGKNNDRLPLQLCSVCAFSKSKKELENDCKRQKTLRANRAKKGVCTLCGGLKEEPSLKTCKKCRDKIVTWRLSHPPLPDKRNQYSKKSSKKLKYKMLCTLSKGNPPKCEWCGCDLIEALEVDHIKGDGKHDEFKRGSKLWRSIVNGERDTSDLRILCKVCNTLHYSMRKYRSKWSVKWEGKNVKTRRE